MKPRPVLLTELRRGDMVVLPFAHGDSVYLLLEVVPTPESTLWMRFYATGGGPDEGWAEELETEEEASGYFTHSGILVRAGQIVPATRR